MSIIAGAHAAAVLFNYFTNSISFAVSHVAGLFVVESLAASYDAVVSKSQTVSENPAQPGSRRAGMCHRQLGSALLLQLILSGRMRYT